ncbi:MAG: YcxB family protein [Bellilinea sp.]
MNTKTQKPITVEFERTVEDTIEFNVFHMSHSPSIRQRALFAQIIVAVLVFIVSLAVRYLLNLDKRALTYFDYALFLVLSVASFFIFPYLNKAEVIRGLHKATKEGDNKAILGHQTISLSPDHIIVKTQSSESKYTWDSIDKVVQSDKYIFVYISSISAIAIPGKAFSTENELQEFANYLDIYREKRVNVKDSE